MMDSINFEFLRSHHRELADLGGFAERYVYSDPASAHVQLRLLGENLLRDFLQFFKIPCPYQDNFLALLQIIQDQHFVPNVILGKPHTIRQHDNVILLALEPYTQTWQEYQPDSTPFSLIEDDLFIEGTAT